MHFAERLEHLPTILPGHPDIEQGQIKRDDQKLKQRLRSVPGENNIVTLRLEQPPHCFANRRVVFGYEDYRFHKSRLAGTMPMGRRPWTAAVQPVSQWIGDHESGSRSV